MLTDIEGYLSGPNPAPLHLFEERHVAVPIWGVVNYTAIGQNLLNLVIMGVTSVLPRGSNPHRLFYRLWLQVVP